MPTETMMCVEADTVVEKIRLLYEHYTDLKNEGRYNRNLTLFAAAIRFRVAPEAFGEKPMTQKQLGEMCSVSPCRVGYQERQVYNKLRTFLNKKPPVPDPVDVDIMITRLKIKRVLKWKE